MIEKIAAADIAIVFRFLSGAVAVHSALHHILIAELRVAALMAGGALAYDRLTLQKTAGLLLITGFACLSVALYRIGGAPLR